MRFDDRLATVLAQPVGSPRDRAIRWRQLVDLVARSGGMGDPALVAAAIDAIRADAARVDENVRAATARAIAGHSPPLPLLQRPSPPSLEEARTAICRFLSPIWSRWSLACILRRRRQLLRNRLRPAGAGGEEDEAQRNQEAAHHCFMAAS